MDYEQLSMVADKFSWVFAALRLNACGKEAKFCRRARLIPPFRLGLALTATSARQQVETRTDFHRGFHALWGPQVSSEACYKQRATPQCAELARTLSARLMSDMRWKVFGFTTGRACGEFRRILIQDGTACAMHAALREVLPGRFKKVKPAAVALHTAMERLCAAPPTVVLPPDTTSAQAFLPEPTALCASGLLADRGSSDLHSLRRVQEAGGCCIIRAKAGMNPQVVEALREDGKRLRSLRNQPLQPIHTTLPQRQRVALGVRWDGDGCPRCLRLIVSWNRRTKRCCSWLTNLPPTRSPREVICRACKGRWPGERRCKEWKAYANRHAFDTAKVAMVAGWIGAAIAAAALKRFLAHATPLIAGVAMSTRQAARCVTYVLSDIVQAWKPAQGAGLDDAFMSAVTSLACHARRAHPQRDRHRGRFQLGLEPLFGNNDAAEIREAA